ncbi:hypothetical protein DUNSADRAFT_7521 [Dunaliella salina]|uniref:Encoded protein n=1 Tax=Dunaliella salina TaxID=3046 RepID=A0ABQ7GL71_DUNSA|nr:hypothetical protein DUNSADRAFT_7521 [Dunaliella salina]|eukprot:KAF5835355.1 hypothetical protein DUNSADRAFT_7521 [Dunaliella salina]
MLLLAQISDPTCSTRASLSLSLPGADNNDAESSLRTGFAGDTALSTGTLERFSQQNRGRDQMSQAHIGRRLQESSGPGK